ncbi:MAG: type II toxin-antitoxin system VapC family toxin [Polyangiales bacterium]
MTERALVVDASVVVEYLVELRLTEHATRLFRTLERKPELELWAPDILYVECVSALRRLVLAKEIPRRAGEERVGKLLRLPLTIAKSGPLMGGVWEQCSAMTAYDACYAELARTLEAPLVTADAKLARVHAARGGKVALLSAL